MARSRNIKPSFFLNENLADLDGLVRLLFIGLWTLADREGRLENRPKRIKAQILPYDDIDIPSAMDALERAGFLLVYGEENQYIQVLNFSKHQSPHQKEAASLIPEPEEHQESPVQAPDKPGASPVQESDEHQKSRPDSLFPLPDSLFPLAEDNSLSHAGEPTGGMSFPTDEATLLAMRQEHDLTAYRAGVPTGRLQQSWENFEDHCRIKGVISQDWPASARKWARNETRFTGAQQGKPASAGDGRKTVSLNDQDYRAGVGDGPQGSFLAGDGDEL